MIILVQNVNALVIFWDNDINLLKFDGNTHPLKGPMR